MKLSRKRRRELRRLRKDAQQLLDQQRVVLGHAGEVLQTAGHQARQLSDEHLQPRIERAVETARPTVERGIKRARRSAENVRRATAPLVAAALTRTIRTLDEIESHDAAKQVRGFGERTGYLKPSKKRRAGGIIAVGLGIAAAAGVGYALWQAFRTDDDLWVAPENSAES
ncbi:DNA/RNA helicase [Leucobacter tenebrionis]|uniref:DNA/RNA helicase n=1 Tax=Leucobacter tenebrionis TaxID=2873270 RepID=UPI001CA6B33C|nr:DNA/RNA helicase [Leucobacter tenebrionis]QZY50858.1 DNA/RNA helicase [Leucobacter tenebrionis]